MKIQVLSVEVSQAMSKAGKPYEQLVVAYKNLDFGKVEQKTLMPFGLQKDTFVTLKGATGGGVYDVDVQKNAAGYNDWVKATKGEANVSTLGSGSKMGTSAVGTSASTATKGGWETPDERAKRQVYIIRQSSVANAVATLSVGAKTAPQAEKIIELAKQFEAFVLGTDNQSSADAGVATRVTAQDIESIEEDIPF